MSKGIVAAAAVIAMTAGTTAFAATAGNDPKALVLQKADLPAGTVKGPTASVAPSTFGDREFTVYYNVRSGAREEVITSDVAVSRQASRASAGYRIMVASYTGLPGGSPLKLPAHGSEQRAEYRPETGRAVLIVRKNAVVWEVAVESCSALSPAGCLGGRTPPKLTKAQAVSELKKYARKQRARIGNG